MAVSQHDDQAEQPESAQQFMESLAASMEMEGLSLSAAELARVREVAAGLIDFAEYRRRVGV